uniref:Gnk2-homologous domain-containing protein n=1 Tax=Oryza rufipogon TaxID=4529 RepID=A0A0E0Q9D2_ORYRU
MVANGSSTSNRSSCVGILAGVRPDQISASAFCCDSSEPAYSDCGACVAMAFRYARWLCGYSRRAMVDLGACRVGYHDILHLGGKLFRSMISLNGETVEGEEPRPIGCHRWRFSSESLALSSNGQGRSYVVPRGFLGTRLGK